MGSTIQCSFLSCDPRAPHQGSGAELSHSPHPPRRGSPGAAAPQPAVTAPAPGCSEHRGSAALAHCLCHPACPPCCWDTACPLQGHWAEPPERLGAAAASRSGAVRVQQGLDNPSPTCGHQLCCHFLPTHGPGSQSRACPDHWILFCSAPGQEREQLDCARLKGNFGKRSDQHQSLQGIPS